ncbi:uncharacterized protein LOC143025749 [Oratosquilla oratoria]|uniref:uncharacterized protein LOC143025749 n=1 Tax=Oratosquilla oratoria TaxID=337810 RepID=UPI003F7782D2
MVIACSVGTEDYPSPKNCCGIFKSYFTTLGVCFGSRSNDSTFQIFEGEHSGISMIIKHQNENSIDFDDSIIDVASLARQGIQLSVLNNVTHPSIEVSGSGFMVVPNSIYSVQLSLGKINNRGLKTWLDLNEKPCLEAWKVLPNNTEDYFDNSANCFLRFIRNNIREICNCSFYTFSTPYDNDTCTLEMMRTCSKTLYTSVMPSSKTSPKRAKSEGNECRPICEETIFKITSTSSPMNPRSLEALKRRHESENSSLSIVDIYYPILKYTHVRNYRSELKDVIGKCNILLTHLLHHL